MAIDLSKWNICTPELDPATGYAKVYSTAELQTLNNTFFDYDGVRARFFAPVAGYTTRSTDRTRTELRETDADGSLQNWLIDGDIDHKLTAALRVMQLPSNGVIVVGQIHSRNGDPLLKLKMKSMSLWASVRATPGRTPVDYKVLDIPYQRRFTYSIHLSPNGHLGVSAGYTGFDGVKHTGNYDAELAGSGWENEWLYFKCGTYNQDAVSDSPDEASCVEFYVINASHL
jgi:hypothetical protein